MSLPAGNRFPRDNNRSPVFGGLSYLNPNVSVNGTFDPATGAQLVTVVAGGSSGTQYTELATTSPGVGTLSLGRYKTAAPTLTDGQMYGLQLDSSGNLKVTGSLSVGGTTDNSAFTAGSSTGTPSMGFYHSTIDAVTDGRAAAIAITANRAQHSNLRNASGTEIGTASTPIQVSLANTSANATAVKVDGSAVTQPVSGTFWQATQPVSGTVTSNIGTTNGLALDASVTGLQVAQASTTSGQSGPLVQTATTTAAPTYTTAKTNPLSTDTSGNLRTSVSNTVTISGTVTANAGTNLNTSLLALESGGNLATLAGAVTSSVLQGNVKQINGVVPLMGNGVTGTGSQRVTIASDNTAFSVNATLSAETTKVIGVTRTADGSGNLLTSTTNALDVNIKSGSIANTSFAVTQATASSLNATVVQGTAAAITGGWPTISGETADTTGTFTNGTQTTSITSSSLSGYQAATVSINGTYGTATAVFEGSDDAGTTWYSLQAARTDSAVIETGYTSLTNTTRMWSLEITGLDSFRVRSTAVASGTANIRISISAAPTSDASTVSIGSALPTGSNVIGALSANQSVNNAQIAGSTTSTAASGTQLVGIADGSGNALTSNSATYTAKKALDANILGTLGTAFTTAGKVDVKAADGDVFVRQTTASNLNATVVGTGTFAVQAAGDVASGSSDSGNPVKQGAVAHTAAPTAVTDGQRVNLIADKVGKQVVVGSIRDLKSNQFTTITSSTAETTVATAVASTFLDVYGCIVENTSATASKVTFKDSTAGTTQFEIYVPAGDTRGFMLPESAAFKQTTVNTNWTATCGTSVASIVISVLYVKNI